LTWYVLHISDQQVGKLFSMVFDARNSRITPIVLIAAKSDETSDRKVSKDDGFALAHRYRCPYVGTLLNCFLIIFSEISSKTGDKIAEAVQEMVDTVKKVQSISSPINQKTGWLRIKKIPKTGGYSSTKKRFVVATESGIRYYKEEPVLTHFY
jgi:hypothetical protein